MRLSIIDRKALLDSELQSVLQRRLRFALSRFGARIERATAVVEDVNEPRGGCDKLCRVTIKLRQGGNVVVTDRDASLLACMRHAADRVGRAVARVIDRSQRVDRTVGRADGNALTPRCHPP